MNVARARPFRVLSVCSGIGGLDLGLHRAVESARTVVYVEREAFAVALLAEKMATGALAPAPVWDDLTTFDGHAWRGAVDCVAGGTPCQDLSVAGKRAGLDGKRSGLFWQFVRVVREAQPAVVFWENVGGAARVLPRVFAAFRAEGYHGAGLRLRAADVGASQERARVFVLAYRDGGAGGKQPGRRFGPSWSGAAEPRHAGEELANGDRGPSAAERTAHHHDGGDAPGHVIDRCDSGPVGDSGHAGLPRPQRQELPGARRRLEGGAASESGGAPMVDASGERRGEVGAECARRERDTTPRGAGEHVGHAECCRCDGRARASGPGSEPRTAAQGAGFPCEWPPGPSADWDSIEADLAPAQPRIRGMADGYAAWLDGTWADRIRGLGNGVVPAQACEAFSLLWEHLGLGGCLT